MAAIETEADRLYLAICRELSTLVPINTDDGDDRYHKLSQSVAEYGAARYMDGRTYIERRDGLIPKEDVLTPEEYGDLAEWNYVDPAELPDPDWVAPDWSVLTHTEDGEPVQP